MSAIRSVLVIPVGIPGCGKSSFGNRLLRLSDTLQVVSTDVIRHRLGDINDQSKNTEVFDTFFAEIVEQFLDGYDVYADATNLHSKSRSELREIARECTVQTHLILFRNLEEAIVRNRKRERVVPDDVMGRMIEQYERMLIAIEQEPYDYVTVIASVR